MISTQPKFKLSQIFLQELFFANDGWRSHKWSQRMVKRSEAANVLWVFTHTYTAKQMPSSINWPSQRTTLFFFRHMQTVLMDMHALWER